MSFEPRVFPEPDLLDTTQAGPAAIRGGALRVGGYLAGASFSIASAAALFRHLGVDETGRYVTVLTIVALAVGVTDAGLVNIGLRESVVGTPATRKRMLSNLLGLRAALTLAAVFAATGFVAVADYGRTMMAGTVIVGLGFLAVNLQAIMTVPLLGELRMGWVTGLDFVRQITTVALILALAAAGATLLPFLAVPLAAGGIVLALTAWVLGSRAAFPAWEVRAWSALLRDTFPYAVAAAVGALYFRVALTVTSLVASEREIGLFGAAYRIVDVLMALPGPAVVAAFPILARAARDDRERLAYAVRRGFETCVVLGAAVGLAVALGAPAAIMIIGGDEFSASVPVLRLQAVGLAFAFISTGLGYALLSLRLHRELLLISLAALATAAGLTLALAPSYGARGAAAAGAAAEVVIAIGAYAFLALRHHPIAPPVGVLARILPALLVGVLPALLWPGVSSVVTGTLGIVAYFAAVLVLRALPPELIAELPGTSILRR
jgi:O-antigen/teichoic acid export membrane protein